MASACSIPSGRILRCSEDGEPVQKYSANIEAYYEFTHLFAALAQTLGEGYALHKQDVFVRRHSRKRTVEIMSS